MFTDKNINHVIVNLDNWLISIEKRKKDSTVLERYDCNAITESIIKLLNGEKIFPPIYDPYSRKRLAEQGKEPIGIERGIILIEGVIALALKELLKKAALKIYVKTDDQIRLARLKKFYLGKGFTNEEARIIISERELEEVPFTKETEIFADISVTVC